MFLIFCSCSADTIPCVSIGESDNVDDNIKIGSSSWPNPFILSDGMLRNSTLKNLDSRKPSSRADRTDILNAVYYECMKYTLWVLFICLQEHLFQGFLPHFASNIKSKMSKILWFSGGLQGKWNSGETQFYLNRLNKY